jgi:hypothetical protein
VENLYYKIEILRRKMNKIALEKGISHPDVLQVSQTLDQILNQYYSINTHL